jgi:dephospho-CoA kinase
LAYVVGLTGGIGSGKSTVCEMLASRGAKIIDADKITHELQQPGTDVFTEMVEAFGPGILSPDGTLDRAATGRIVFADASKRERLQQIVWPRVGARVAELVRSAGDDEVVVLDVPLMAESTAASTDTSTSSSRRFAQKIIVVDASPETQLRHLEAKGVARADAEARMAAQVSREERLELADYVINNDGSMDELESRVEEVWREIRS